MNLSIHSYTATDAEDNPKDSGHGSIRSTDSATSRRAKDDEMSISNKAERSSRTVNIPTSEHSDDSDDEVTFTNESGEIKIIRTRDELMKEINHYDNLRIQAVDERKYDDAFTYQKCLDRLEKLRQDERFQKAITDCAGEGTPVYATTDCTVDKVIRILGLRPATKKYLSDMHTLKEFEEFMQLPCEEIMGMTTECENAGDSKKIHVTIFNQSERAKLILLRRWMNENRLDHHNFDWQSFSKQRFNEFASEVEGTILDEILDELKLYEKKDKLKRRRISTPGLFVEKSKYWYKYENFDLDDTDIYEIEKFKRWYKYKLLGPYLPSDWIVTYRKEAVMGKEFEWRKVMKDIGLKVDAVQALEINEIRDFSALNHRSKKWRVTMPASKKNTTREWNEWQQMGLLEKDARNIIHFRHWYNFYVTKKDKSDWTSEFDSSQFERFVQRYIDPSKLDDFKKPNWWQSKTDTLELSQERQDYYDMLQAVAEDGAVAEVDRYRLKEHYEGRRREKMDLILEIMEGSGDKSFQEKRLREIGWEEASSDGDKKAADLIFFQKYNQFFYSTLVAYVLLLCWVATTGIFISDVFTRDPILEHDYGIFIHNITFGLTTAVVIAELGEEAKQTSVHSRFQEIYKEQLQRSKNNIFQAKLKLRKRSPGWRTVKFIEWRWVWLQEKIRNILTGLILNSTRRFILTWVFFGTISLGFGVFGDLRPTNPLYTTGQTWAGIAVTIGYSYFGLNDASAEVLKPTNDEKKVDTTSQVGDVPRDIDGEEASFTDEIGETKIIMTRCKLMNEIDRYYGLRKKAEGANNFEDASMYQTCLDQLRKLRRILPTVEELTEQLLETQADMNKAVSREDFDTAGMLKKEVNALKKKLKEEEVAADDKDDFDLASN